MKWITGGKDENNGNGYQNNSRDLEDRRASAAFKDQYRNDRPEDRKRHGRGDPGENNTDEFRSKDKISDESKKQSYHDREKTDPESGALEMLSRKTKKCLFFVHRFEGAQIENMRD